jgi:ADP-ribose pyrophosphatase YjhB (NUDIX family)
MTVSHDELVDYVDAEDRFVRTGPRGGAGEHRLHYRTATTVLVTRRREVLVYRWPAAAKVCPGHHDVLVGGTARAGETYRAAARRELAGELGINPVRREVLKLRRKSPIGPCHLAVYLAELPARCGARFGGNRPVRGAAGDFDALESAATVHSVRPRRAAEVVLVTVDESRERLADKVLGRPGPGGLIQAPSTAPGPRPPLYDTPALADVTVLLPAGTQHGMRARPSGWSARTPAC